MNDKKTYRQIKKHMGIELLRIIAMLWIIAFHYAEHGVIDMMKESITVSWIILAFCRIGGGLGNCIFVLITGCFMWNNHFKLQKIVYLWLEIWIYSIGCGMICFWLGQEQMTLRSVIKMLMPITFNEYWYMSTYVLLYFLVPYINKIIESLDKKQHIFFNILFLLFFSVIPTATDARWTVGAGHLFIFVGLYMIGAFIDKYNIIGLMNGKRNYIGFVAGVVGIWISEIVLKCVNINPFYFSWEIYKTPVVLTAIFMFLIFRNMQIDLPEFILKTAETVGGVYLFHIGRLQKIIFGKIFRNDIVYSESAILLLHLVITILLIFIVGVLVNKIIIKVLKTTIYRYIGNAIKKSERYIDSYILK